jgi:hypothetical protein
MTKLVYMFSTCSLSLLKKVLQLDVHQQKHFLHDLQIICVEYWLAAFRATSDEISSLAIYLQSKCLEIYLET